ncbi:hypothetical protein [Bradyrhizobium sp. SZCCHNPS10062]|uniref:hypothetical protein n=1 Tax=unclassified Bradyrhizobium TaxID=2631580 RepID=UPI0039648C1B
METIMADTRQVLADFVLRKAFDPVLHAKPSGRSATNHHKIRQAKSMRWAEQSQREPGTPSAPPAFDPERSTTELSMVKDTTKNDPRETPNDDPRERTDWPSNKQTDKPWQGNPEKDRIAPDRPDIDLEKWKRANTS